VVLHLLAQGLEEGDEHPPYALLWKMVDFTLITCTFTPNGTEQSRTDDNDDDDDIETLATNWTRWFLLAAAWAASRAC